MTANLRGILLMTAAMALFAVEDGLIKLAANAGLSPGMITLALGLLGLPVFLAWALVGGHRPFGGAVRSWPLALRCGGEMVGTLGVITALALIPISVLSAILQATPIVVTAAAAIVLGERVGWRRWTAVCAGFAGVLMILRPASDGFDPNALWAVLGVAGLTIRDLATRRMPRGVATPVVAVWGYAAVTVLGAAMVGAAGGAALPAGTALAYMLIATAIGVVAYWTIIEATRAGDVSVITPFRYTRLVFALAVGFAVFAERPDAWMLAGAALVIASGLYTLYRERYHGVDRAHKTVAHPAVPSAATPALNPEARP